MKNAQGKRWLSILLAVVMIASVGLFAVSAAPEAEPEIVSGTCGENLTWAFDADTGELTISGTGKMTSNSPLLPWRNYNNDIKAVTISDGVTSIGEWAFSNCLNLTNVTIPNSVTIIGWGAFWGCSSLTNIAIPSGISMIDKNAFVDCTSLVAFTVDESNPVFSSDTNGVLYNKDKTTLIQYPIGSVRNTFTIPDTVTTIGYLAFSGNTNLTSISIPSSVKTIDMSAFARCTSLTSVIIPDSVETIGDFAFSECTNLSSITFPNSVKSIGSDAFQKCTSLTNVTIPASVTDIGAGVFQNCKSLSAITVDTGNPAYYSDANGVLYTKDRKTLMQYPAGNTRNAFSIPDSVATICFSAFAGCTELAKITIPNSVTTIEDSSFSDCAKLADITIPDSVTRIDGNAFRDCVNLSNVSLPRSITTIAYCAFEGCTSLTSVMIPVNVTRISERAFSGCISLADIMIPNSVTEIGKQAFFNCSSLTFMHIPASVTSIGDYTFSHNFDPYGQNADQHGFNLLPIYICSSTADCYAKTYAEENGIEFRICTNHDPSVAIRDFVPEKTVGYRETLTFAADVTNAVDGAEVHWFINGEDVGTGETYTTAEVTKDFTVQAKYMKDGAVLAESETETVNVKSGFVDRLVAFFRILFGKLLALFRKYFCVIFK